ncbi:MAG: tryptophan transporter [Tissierellia bacterium]|nr:tryptophan transporter [Tissierellia bacterium]
MKTKDLVQGAILLALGTILHFVVPGFVNGVKPDFLTVCMFVAIIAAPSVQNSLVLGVAAGILAALTTSFPGGQLPNFVDKVASALFCYGLLQLLPSYVGGRSQLLARGINFVLSTMVSGGIFLLLAMVMVGLPGGAKFFPMFVAIVLPTALVNGLAGTVIDRAVSVYRKRMSLS